MAPAAVPRVWGRPADNDIVRRMATGRPEANAREERGPNGTMFGVVLVVSMDGTRPSMGRDSVAAGVPT